jgi:transposase
VPPGRHQQNLYYRWSEEFLAAGKKRGDTARAATRDEVTGLRAAAPPLTELLAEVLLEHRLRKKV